MNRPQVIGQPTSQEHFAEGLNIIANLLAPTLGPTGGYVVSETERSTKYEYLSDSSVAVRRIISMGHPQLDIGAMVMRNIIWRIGQRAGDGGATTAVLTRAIFNEGTRLLASGVNVALGTDSAASNNDLNMFGELQSAALLAKLQAMDASALPAADALAMATINGAKAMGLEDSLGSLEVGKQADLIAVDLSGPETQPLYNPLSQLVYACNGSQVTHSWIAGEPVMSQRQLKGIDLDDLTRRVSEWQQRISSTTSTAE